MKTQQEQMAYENACDCLCYGFGRKHWNSCGLSSEDALKIWREAFHDMTNNL